MKAPKEKGKKPESGEKESSAVFFKKPRPQFATVPGRPAGAKAAGPVRVIKPNTKELPAERLPLILEAEPTAHSPLLRERASGYAVSTSMFSSWVAK